MIKLPSVVIVGRTNVGKSSLFNRLTESSKALISQQAGTTRDYNLGTVAWRKKTFQLIDTGGVNIDILKNSIQALLPNNKESQKILRQTTTIEKEIILQTKEALGKADVVMMVVDGQSGLLPEDRELALVIKKLNIPTFLVCNKIDNPKYRHQINDFFALGLGQPYPVSAANGSGVGDFLDELIKKIKGRSGRPAKEVIQTKGIRVALIGKPNAGKSSLVNQILGEKRVIVSETPQTTREPQDTEIIYKGKKVILIDTAGIKKKARVEPGIEKTATRKSLNTIKNADVIMFMTDVSQGLTKQDSAISGMIRDEGKGLIIIANKWDLVEGKTTASDQEFRNYYQKNLPHLSFAPLVFTSALTGKNVDKLLDLVLEIYEELNKEISDEVLQTVLEEILKKHRPTQAKGPKRPKIRSLSQLRTNPQIFIVTVGAQESVHFSYLRFIENRLRERFNFLGVPVTIRVASGRE
ncbi:MAG: ribosome biogenesis GTPase Der [Candidatus Buchananbacteria bacterium]|nr:ribosome biogenesis GTPase Der [Candidatus Buchananbacteria bacterium]